ncbi:helix-turn-helix domain-containing protein [Protaetiibacter intestinalis]|uniref:TetR/AcrR family transcriptional regulator n=1 Tax=Protaetiibacter intestinalis TaxID=2419774 RepID=A0A387B782_9MICO|nr:TetR/AcrR family transcriptional regulator [Protaetiibacter intestinalis]AYF96926.1 TetR/AcrR family transcriptional regulator [Protaetiibacter intestinalis]
MARWLPGARGRLAAAALELATERGYDQTTVADIAARAGVTERTYYRHFADKREAFFGGSDTLIEQLRQAIVQADAALPPVAAAAAGARAMAAQLTDVEHSRLRARVVASDDALRERELLKLASLSTAAAAALRERGTAALPAGLLGDAAVSAFARGIEQWLEEGGELTAHVDAAFAAIGAALGG